VCLTAFFAVVCRGWMTNASMKSQQFKLLANYPIKNKKNAFFVLILMLLLLFVAMVGLALAYAGSITESLAWLVRYVTTTENQMNSVERMEHYIQYTF
jgi:hypothetical protein